MIMNMMILYQNATACNLQSIHVLSYELQHTLLLFHIYLLLVGQS